MLGDSISQRATGRLSHNNGAGYVKDLPLCVGRIIPKGASNTMLFFSRKEYLLFRFILINSLR